MDRKIHSRTNNWYKNIVLQHMLMRDKNAIVECKESAKRKNLGAAVVVTQYTDEVSHSQQTYNIRSQHVSTSTKFFHLTSHGDHESGHLSHRFQHNTS